LGLRRRRQGHPGRRLRPRLSAPARGAHRGAHEAPGEDPAGALARPEGRRRGRGRLSGMAGLEPSAVHARLAARFASAVGALEGTRPDNQCATIAPASLVEVARFCKTDPDLAFDCLSNLSGVDYPKREVIQVVYHLWSYPHRHQLVLKADAPRD